MTNKDKSYCGKWALIGVTRDDYKIIYQKLRSEAKTILKQKYEKQYLKILNKLLEKEYNKLRSGENAV